MTIFRYDLNLDLVACTNTTNITIARDTFISTYNTPDLISVNVTRLYTQDYTSLATIDAINKQNEVIAELITTIPRIFHDFGVQVTYNSSLALLDLITSLQANAELYGAAAIASRDATLSNYTALFAAFQPQMEGAISEGNAILNDSKNLLAILTSQNINATSVLADLVDAAAAVNAAVANVTETLKAFANATVAVAQAVLNGLQGSGADFGSFFSFLGSAASTVGNALGDAIDWTIKQAGKVVSFAKDVFETALGMGVDLFKGIFFVLIALVGLILVGLSAYYYYTEYVEPKKPLTYEKAQKMVSRMNEANAVVARGAPVPPASVIPAKVASTPAGAAAAAATAAVTGGAGRSMSTTPSLLKSDSASLLDYRGDGTPRRRLAPKLDDDL